MRTFVTITVGANVINDPYSVVLELVGLNQVFGPKHQIRIHSNFPSKSTFWLNEDHNSNAHSNISNEALDLINYQEGQR